jgi:ethanolamine kinase
MTYILDLTSSIEDPYSLVKEFIIKVFAEKYGTRPSEGDKLEISQLKGGITNMLLQGTYLLRGQEEKFLIRAYGRGTSTIIDRDREFATHLHLYSHSLAPALHARFGNGLIYGFIPGKSVHYSSLSHPEIMRAVSNKLAQWHFTLNKNVIQQKIEQLRRSGSGVRPDASSSSATNLFEIISQWIDICPDGLFAQTKDEFRAELQWIKKTIGQVGPTVVAHCDLLSGNIIVPVNWTESAYNRTTIPDILANETAEAQKTQSYKPSNLATFIDYEYAMPAPRGFDLANHFMEWQGFDCKTELIPEPSMSNPVLRYWAFHYLAALNHLHRRNPVIPSEKAIDDLIHEVITWWGMPGFYWGIWSAIQSTISEIDFDYSSYAEQRMSEYFSWKTQVGTQLARL